MSRYEYRIMVNGVYSPIYKNGEQDELWRKICSNEDRVDHAKLESRLVTDTSIIPMLTSMSDIAIKFKDLVILHWESIAEIKNVVEV